MTEQDKPRCETPLQLKPHECRYPVHACVTHHDGDVEVCTWCGLPADTDSHQPKGPTT